MPPEREGGRGEEENRHISVVLWKGDKKYCCITNLLLYLKKIKVSICLIEQVFVANSNN